jgi:hypothetical protein
MMDGWMDGYQFVFASLLTHHGVWQNTCCEVDNNLTRVTATGAHACANSISVTPNGKPRTCNTYLPIASH